MDEPQQDNDKKEHRRLESLSVIVFFVIFLSVITYLIYIYETRSHREFNSKPKGFSTIVMNQFNGPTGEHQKLKKYAKNSLEYPASYKHIETIYIRNDSHQEVFVRTMFSGQDSYKTERIFCIKATYSFDSDEIKPPTSC